MVVSPSTDIVSFFLLAVLVMVTLYPMMGTPSRVKGGLQEIKIVVELIATTSRLLTDSSKPACIQMKK